MDFGDFGVVNSDSKLSQSGKAKESVKTEKEDVNFSMFGSMKSDQSQGSQSQQSGQPKESESRSSFQKKD